MLTFIRAGTLIGAHYAVRAEDIKYAWEHQNIYKDGSFELVVCIRLYGMDSVLEVADPNREVLEEIDNAVTLGIMNRKD